MKITLRDLFWLVLVVGMGCAWWMTYQELASARDETKQVYEELHASLKREDTVMAFLKLKGYHLLWQTEVLRVTTSDWESNAPK